MGDAVTQEGMAQRIQDQDHESDLRLFILCQHTGWVRERGALPRPQLDASLLIFLPGSGSNPRLKDTCWTLVRVFLPCVQVPGLGSTGLSILSLPQWAVSLMLYLRPPLPFQDSNQYQLGKTKIFFRAGQVAYLEKLRLDTLRQACVVIQKRVRGWLQRKKFLRARHAAVIIQRYCRGQLTVRCAQEDVRVHRVPSGAVGLEPLTRGPAPRG